MKPVAVLAIAIAILTGGYFLLGNRQPIPLTDTPAVARPDSAETTNSDMFVTPGPHTLQTQAVAYHGPVQGFYATPEAAGDYPGIVMIHEWWGLNDNVRDMARLLSSQGYHVLAVDLYNGSVATTQEEARAQTSALNQDEALANMRSAKAFLKEKGANSLATLGWCFGGGQALRMSLAEGDLAATVIYYGNLETDAGRLQTISWPVLGIFGAEDQSIPVSDVQAFEAALTQNGTENDIHIYPGVGHAFANPSGANYAERETRDAWEKTVAFLAKHLKQ